MIILSWQTNNKGQNQYDKKVAIPSIFELTSHLIKAPPSRNLPFKEKNQLLLYIIGS
jgi:hypothetical protein